MVTQPDGTALVGVMPDGCEQWNVDAHAWAELIAATPPPVVAELLTVVSLLTNGNVHDAMVRLTELERKIC